MHPIRVILTIAAASVLGILGFLFGAGSGFGMMGKIVGATLGGGLGLFAGLTFKLDNEAAKKSPETTKVGRAIIVGILFAFVGAVIGAIWSQVGPVGGVAQYGAPGSPARMDILPAYLGGGALLGLLAGATVGVLSVRRRNGEGAKDE